MKSPEDRWVIPKERKLLSPPPGKQWRSNLEWYEDMIPVNYRPLMAGEFAKKGDYALNYPHYKTGQIWYYIHVDQDNLDCVITKRK